VKSVISFLVEEQEAHLVGVSVHVRQFASQVIHVFIEVMICGGLHDKQLVALEEHDRQLGSQLRQAAPCMYFPMAQLVQVVGVPEQDKQVVSQLTQELLNSIAVIGQEVQVLGSPEQVEHMGEHTLQVLPVIICRGAVHDVQLVEVSEQLEHDASQLMHVLVLVSTIGRLQEVHLAGVGSHVLQLESHTIQVFSEVRVFPVEQVMQ
jgi:hypothetical protein